MKWYILYLICLLWYTNFKFSSPVQMPSVPTSAHWCLLITFCSVLSLTFITDEIIFIVSDLSYYDNTDFKLRSPMQMPSVPTSAHWCILVTFCSVLSLTFVTNEMIFFVSDLFITIIQTLSSAAQCKCPVFQPEHIDAFW